MKRFRKARLLVLGFTLIAGLSLSVWLRSEAQTQPLTYPEINTALKTKLPNKSFKTKAELISWLIAQVNRRKLDKPLTQDREEDLRQAGATNELIEVIRRNSPSLRTQTPLPTPSATPAKTPAVMDKTFKNSLGMEFVRISKGTFTMGSSREEELFDHAPHRVTISRDFYIGKYEVTQGQWKALMGNNPSTFSECGASCPVETVSWNDVQEFIAKLNAKNEGTYRLPSEAEWEYAARAGTTTAFGVGSGDKLSSNDANFDGTRGEEFAVPSQFLAKPVRVGSYKPNAWGLYDMHGNVLEWCADWYDESYYSNSPGVDPKGPASGKMRIKRGGSWLQDAERLRSAQRNYNKPDDASPATGFRLVME